MIRKINGLANENAGSDNSLHIFWLTDEQFERLRPYFPTSRGKPRVDDRRVLSGIIYVKKNGLQWKDAPAVYGPPKTLYNRFVRWSRIGVFARIFVELAQPGPDGELIMIDSTHLGAQHHLHRSSRHVIVMSYNPREHGQDHLPPRRSTLSGSLQNFPILIADL